LLAEKEGTGSHKAQKMLTGAVRQRLKIPKGDKCHYMPTIHCDWMEAISLNP